MGFGSKPGEEERCRDPDSPHKLMTREEFRSVYGS
eukprot:gene48221-53577_t